MNNLGDKLKGISTDLKDINQVGNTRIVDIDIDQLIDNPNSHYSINEVDRMAEWIELSGGILNPILVYKKNDKYMIEAGHKRRAGAKKLNLKTVPCIIGDSRDEILRIIATNQHRIVTKEEKKIEIERMREILKEKGITNINEKIAELFDVDVRTIYRNAAEDKANDEKDPISENEKIRKKVNKIIADLEKNIEHFTDVDIAFVEDILKSY